MVSKGIMVNYTLISGFQIFLSLVYLVLASFLTTLFTTSPMINGFALVLIVTNLLSVVLALEILAEKRHAKLLSVTFGIFDLISVPFGTFFGIYVILRSIKSDV